jgi:hypothetical protein
VGGDEEAEEEAEEGEEDEGPWAEAVTEGFFSSCCSNGPERRGSVNWVVRQW